MSKQRFHLVTDEDLKDVVKGSILLGEAVTFDANGITNIPAFPLGREVKGLKLSDFKTADLKIHVVIGNEYKSYFVFILTKGNKSIKLALAMEDSFPHLPVIKMTREIHIATHEPSLETKGDRKKNLLTVKLKGDALETYHYGLTFFLDKNGLLNRTQSEAIPVKEELAKEKEEREKEETAE